MAIQGTALGLTNAIGTRYALKYQEGAAMRRLYDQLAMPVGAPQFDLESRRGMGSSYTFQFVSDMTPGSSAISESVDISAQLLRDATATITPTSRGEALKWSELLDLQAFTDLIAKRSQILGENAMETIEVVARQAALQGDLVSRYVARASLDGATAAHRWSSDVLWQAATQIQAMRCPPLMVNGRAQWLAIAHPDSFIDLLLDGDITPLPCTRIKKSS